MKHTSQLAKVHMKDNRIVLIMFIMIPYKSPNITTKSMYHNKATIRFHLKEKLVWAVQNQAVFHIYHWSLTRKTTRSFLPIDWFWGI